jgi:ribosome-binding protein aMBF1 (putative translation factor)
MSTGVIIQGMILESIAKAIKQSGKSYNELSSETGIDRAVLCRIVSGSGTGSCSTKTADKLCKYLRLELAPKKAKKKA